MTTLTTPVCSTGYLCPSCSGGLDDGHDALTCPDCARTYPVVAGLPDLRLGSDRYLDLAAERAKACRLHAVEPTVDVMGLASAYYRITDDVIDRRRDRFLRHIAGAVARGEALASRLPDAPGRVLEIGCGSGGFLVAAARIGVRVEGADIAARWLVVARRRLADHGLSVPLTVAQTERLPWPDATFDTVVADSLIEHLDDPALALSEWSRVLRPGGTLLLWSPNRYSLATDPHLGVWGLGWLPRRWLPVYLRLRKRTEWTPYTRSARGAVRLVGRNGFVAASVGPPAITGAWSDSRPFGQRFAICLYNAAARAASGRALLTRVGPLWELRAQTRGS